MKIPGYWWLARFVQITLVLGFSIALMAMLLGALLPPILRLAIHGVWQWEPLNTWVRYSLLGGMAGPLSGGCFTLIEWWQLTQASRLMKVVVTTVVVVLCVGLVAFLKPLIWNAFPN